MKKTLGGNFLRTQVVGLIVEWAGPVHSESVVGLVNGSTGLSVTFPWVVGIDSKGKQACIAHHPLLQGKTINALGAMRDQLVGDGYRVVMVPKK